MCSSPSVIPHMKSVHLIFPLSFYSEWWGLYPERERDGAGVRQLPPVSGVGWREEARGVQAPG